MRIAYVCTDRGVRPFGTKGSSVHVQEVLRALLRRGASIDLFAARLGGRRPAGLDGVVTHELRPASAQSPAEKERAALGANDAFRHRLEAAGPFDLVYERHALFSYTAMEFAREHGVPGLLEVNAPLIDEQRTYRQLVHEREAEDAASRVFAAATCLLAVSGGVADHLRAHAAVASPVHVVPNGVDPDRFSPQVPPALPPPRTSSPGELTVGFVGTLKPWHGVDILLDAFARVRSDGMRLLVVGDGPERQRLDTKIEDLSLRECVHMAGAVEPSVIPAMLTSMDVAVAPYPPIEGFYFSPLKIFEYMASARAVIASAIGQVTEILRDGETGLLVPPGDADALADAITRLRDAAVRRRLGAAARAQASDRHTWDAVVGRILALAGIQFSGETADDAGIVTTRDRDPGARTSQ